MGIFKLFSGVLGKSHNPLEEPDVVLGDEQSSQDAALIIVEKDKRMRFTYAQILKGKDIAHAVCPEFPDKASLNPEIIILDALPCLKDLKRIRDRFPGAKLGLVSSETSHEFAIECQLAGIAHYLVKPISQKALFDYLKRIERNQDAGVQAMKSPRPESRKNFLQEAEELRKLFIKAGMSQESFSKAHGISTSRLAYETKLSEVDETTKELITRNIDCFRKTYLTEAGLSLSPEQLHELCLEIVERCKNGEKVDLAWVKERVKQLPD